jgi:hypothetical protein
MHPLKSLGDKSNHTRSSNGADGKTTWLTQITAMLELAAHNKTKRQKSMSSAATEKAIDLYPATKYNWT